MHKAGVIVVLLPVVTTAWVSALLLWGPAVAWRHTRSADRSVCSCSNCSCCSYRGVPFARVYVPGGSRFHMLWPLYLSGFIVYTYSAAAAERELLLDGGLAATCLTFLTVAAALVGRPLVEHVTECLHCRSTSSCPTRPSPDST